MITVFIIHKTHIGRCLVMGGFTIEYLRELLAGVNLVSIVCRILMAVVFSGGVGWERGVKGHPAGLRTYMLVCIGAALVMITNQYIAELYPGTDPARMGAQVVNGIGFLGAGTIIVTRRQQVKGLTTAAGLWACACMGLAIGVGFYAGAIVGTIAIYIIIVVMHNIGKKTTERLKLAEVYMEFQNAGDIRELIEIVSEQAVHIESMHIVESKSRNEQNMAVVAKISIPDTISRVDVMDTLKAVECVEEVELV